MVVEFIPLMRVVVIAVSRLVVRLWPAYFDMAEDIFFTERLAAGSRYIYSLGFACTVGYVQVLAVFITSKADFCTSKVFACKDDTVTFGRVEVKDFVCVAVVAVEEEGKSVCSLASFKQVRPMRGNEKVIAIRAMQGLPAVLGR